MTLHALFANLMSPITFAEALLLAPYIFLLFPTGTIKAMVLRLDEALDYDLMRNCMLGTTSLLRLLLVAIIAPMLITWISWWIIVPASLGILLVIRTHFHDWGALRKEYDDPAEESAAVDRVVRSLQLQFVLICVLAVFSVAARISVGWNVGVTFGFFLLFTNTYTRLTKDRLPFIAMVILAAISAGGYYLHTRP